MKIGDKIRITHESSSEYMREGYIIHLIRARGRITVIVIGKSLSCNGLYGKYKVWMPIDTKIYTNKDTLEVIYKHNLNYFYPYFVDSGWKIEVIEPKTRPYNDLRRKENLK